ncbi:MAG: T9SS type A sorting domain-containing protein [Melioribacter sp.]|nr:T9SS type A sorting domain-containing protein [Melioribacter sp.]
MKRAIIIFFIFSIPMFAQNFEWQVVTGWDMKYPVSGGQVVYDNVNNKFYVLGGENASKEIVDWIQEYDILTGEWKIVGKMSQPRFLFVADIWNNQIIYFGGVSEFTQNKNILESWALKSFNSEPTFLDTQNNFARSFSTGYVIDNILYIIGGEPIPNGTTELPYIAGYDLINKQISFTYGNIGPNLPKQQMTILRDNNIYILGGVLNGALSSISRFDINTKQIVTLQQRLLTPRAGGVAIYNPVLGRGFVIGGFNETNKALRTVEQVLFSSDGGFSIYPFASLKFARRNPMAINYGNTVVVFGGRDENGNIVPQLEKLVEVTSDFNDDKTVLPKSDFLYQNYPNPFNPSTTISFELAGFTTVSLDIFSLLGEHVITLKEGYLRPGRYSVVWDGKDKFGREVPTGIYFVTLKTNSQIQTRKMVLLK